MPSLYGLSLSYAEFVMCRVDLIPFRLLKVKPVYQQMTLSPKLGVVEISTLWHFRLPLPIQMFIKVVSSPRLSGIGMPSPIL